MEKILEESSEMQKERVLICDDDSSLRKRLARMLRDRDYLVFEAGCVKEAREVLQEFEIGSCIVDMRMPDESGMMLLDYISDCFPEIRTVVFTGFGTIQNAADAVKKGAVEYLTKPASIEAIISAISQDTSKSGYQDNIINMPSLEEVEMEYIRKVLSECEGNITAAAKILGLHRRSLQRKLSRG